MVRQKINHGHEVYSVWVNGATGYGQNRSNGNVFFQDDIIYSYGTHFRMGVRIGDTIILNADTYSVTTSGQQSALRRAVAMSDKKSVLIPFSSLREAGINPRDIKIIEVEPDREITLPERMRVNKFHQHEDNTKCWQWWNCERTHEYREEREAYKPVSHLMGRSVFRVGHRYYLSGIDETAADLWSGYFLAQLPHAVHSVAEAVESLKPDEVKAAESSGIDVLRQGEFFFIPVDVELKGIPEVPKTDSRIGWWERNVNARFLTHKNKQRIERHYATHLKRMNGSFYAKGTVRHTNRDHRMLRLNGWHKVLENREVRSFAAMGRVD